jgi:hypothetical protein
MRAATFRRLALELPGAEEVETWETATFRVRRKIFAMFSDKERDAWVKSTGDEQAALVEMRPDAFFVPPYVGPNGWIGLRVSKVDAEEARELLIEAWRMTATKRAVTAFDLEEGLG